MAISTKLITERQLDNFKSLSTQIETNQQKIATGDALKDASEDPVKAVKISLYRYGWVVPVGGRANYEKTR